MIRRGCLIVYDVTTLRIVPKRRQCAVLALLRKGVGESDRLPVYGSRRDGHVGSLRRAVVSQGHVLHGDALQGRGSDGVCLLSSHKSDGIIVVVGRADDVVLADRGGVRHPFAREHVGRVSLYGATEGDLRAQSHLRFAVGRGLRVDGDGDRPLRDSHRKGAARLGMIRRGCLVIDSVTTLCIVPKRRQCAVLSVLRAGVGEGHGHPAHGGRRDGHVGGLRRAVVSQGHVLHGDALQGRGSDGVNGVPVKGDIVVRVFDAASDRIAPDHSGVRRAFAREGVRDSIPLRDGTVGDPSGQLERSCAVGRGLRVDGDGDRTTVDRIGRLLLGNGDIVVRRALAEGKGDVVHPHAGRGADRLILAVHTNEGEDAIVTVVRFALLDGGECNEIAVDRHLGFDREGERRLRNGEGRRRIGQRVVRSAVADELRGRDVIRVRIDLCARHRAQAHLVVLLKVRGGKRRRRHVCLMVVAEG